MRKLLYLLTLFICAHLGLVQATETKNIAPYLLPDAPAFDMTITQFREKFNHKYPETPLRMYHAVSQSASKNIITPAATKITNTIYSSTALELGTGKIKTLQITWLPNHDTKDNKALAMMYMANLIHFFSPQYTQQQSKQQLEKLLRSGKRKSYIVAKEGSIRYVVSDHRENGLTFAVEPIKLMMSSQS